MTAIKKISRLAVVGFMLLLTGCPSQHVDSLYGVRVTGDGAGGAFAVYEDKLGGSIYVQKISPEGKTPWGEKGTLLGNTGSQSYEYSGFNIVGDGSGGAVVAWYSIPPKNTQTSFIFHVSRLSSNGQLLWQQDLWRVDQMKGDGAGGVVMGYVLNGELYANAISGDGTLRTPVGTRIAPGHMDVPSLGLWQMAADGEGGAIFVWTEHQYPAGVEPGKTTSRDHLFVQRIDQEGKLLWGDSNGNGQSVYFPPTGTWLDTLQAAGDGKGGMVLSWFQMGAVVSDNSGNRSQKVGLVVQKIDAVGKVLWGDSGIQLAIEEAGGRPVPSDGSLVTTDGSGGVIVGWRDMRVIPNDVGMYAQRITADGRAQWPPEGVRVSSTSLNPRPMIIGDGMGGMIAAYWYQQDNKMLNLQRVDGSGNILWQQNGVTVARGSFASFSVSSDGLGGAVVGWGGGGPGSEKAYIQRVSADGRLMWGEKGILLGKTSGAK